MARFVTGDCLRTSRVTIILHQLLLPTLQEWRAENKVIMMYGMTIIPHTIFKHPNLSTFLLQEHYPSLEQFAITPSLSPVQSRLTPLRPSCRTSSYNCLPYFQLSIVTFNCTFISWHATVRLCTRWWTELYSGEGERLLVFLAKWRFETQIQ